MFFRAGGGAVSTRLIQLGAAMEHAIEFVDEERHGLVALVGRHHGVERGPGDGDMTFRGKTFCNRLFRIALEFYAYARYPLLMSEQSLGFFLDKGFQGRGEVEVDAGDDQFVLRSMSVHGTFVGCCID